MVDEGRSDRIEPGALNPETPEGLEIAQRNAFMESLSIEARDRFLRALQDAAVRGLSDRAAWEEAVVAAETTYTEPEVVEEVVLDENGDIVADATLVESPDPLTEP